MYTKLIKNDIRKSKLATATITAFIMLAALLTSLAAILSVNLSGAIDNMMTRAETPHVLQMHSGLVDMDRLAAFAAAQNSVEDYQVLEFLNIEGGEIVIGTVSLADSVQDNGLSVQSSKFDYLLDLNGEIITPADGEIYMPLYYMREGPASLGGRVEIHGVSFIIAGFLRDSQMNSSFISSKRFLVSEGDFEKMKAYGKMEQLIEFRLHDPSESAALVSAYVDAGLESNGPPAITYSLFGLANALSDGIMIALLMLIGVLVILVTFLCIRFSLIAKIEEDYKEIGVLKAVGIRVSGIKNLYMAKYGAIAVLACILGFLLALIAKEPLMENIRLYMGVSNQIGLSLLCGLVGTVVIFIILMLYVNGVLRRFKKISAAEAVRFGAPQEKTKSGRGLLLSNNKLYTTNVFLGLKDVLVRKKLYVTMLMVLVISAFIIVVPQNIYNTISSRSFIRYMGIGECDMRVDVQQTDDIPLKTYDIAAVMDTDESIEKYSVLISMMFDLQMEDGSIQRFKVELGDHSIFPIAYSQGRAPLSDDEIVISAINADDLEKTVGDSLTLIINEEAKVLTICGIYSDITNGGKTAKAVFAAEEKDVLWGTIPVRFYDHSITDAKVTQYKQQYSFAKVSRIDDYIEQSFGSVIDGVRKASVAAIAATVLLTILVTLLFMKMLIAKDRYSIAVLKSFGFTSADIRRQYVTRSVLILIIGCVLGTILSNTLGELVGVVMISSFGASSFRFEVNPVFAYLLSPLIILSCVYIATIIGVSDIQSIKVSEYIKE